MAVKIFYILDMNMIGLVLIMGYHKSRQILFNKSVTLPKGGNYISVWETDNGEAERGPVRSRA